MLDGLYRIYEKDYKKLIVFPVILSVFFSSALIYRFLTTGEFFPQDITIKGGTSVTFYSNQTFELSYLEEVAERVFLTDDVSVRQLMDISGKVMGYELQIGEEVDHSAAFSGLSSELGIMLDRENTSINSQSALIASSFLRDSMWIMVLAFFLMSLVIYYNFKSIIPAVSIVGSTLLDVIGILGVFALFDIKFSVATIGALLMVIGYSTDSDVLLASNLLKGRGDNIMGRIKKAAKTEATMVVSAMATYLIMLLLSNVSIIQHIALVLFISIIFDVINTWILSAGLQRMYLGRPGK